MTTNKVTASIAYAVDKHRKVQVDKLEGGFYGVVLSNNNLESLGDIGKFREQMLRIIKGSMITQIVLSEDSMAAMVQAYLQLEVTINDQTPMPTLRGE